MKTKYRALFLTLLTSISCFSQTTTKPRTDSAKPVTLGQVQAILLAKEKELGTKLDSMKKKDEAQDKRIEELSADEKKRKDAGSVKLKMKKVGVYEEYKGKEASGWKSTKDSTELVGVSIEFQTGRLQRIKVNVKNDPTGAMYYYLDRPMNVMTTENQEKLRDVHLFASNNKNRFIFVRDVLIFNPENPRRFIVEDCQVDLTFAENENEKKLMGEHEFPVSGKIYTDVEGYSENKPNGIAQTELSIPLHFIRKGFVGNNMSTYFFYNVVPEFTWSKPDKKLRYLPVGRANLVNGTRDYVNTFGLWQYSEFNFGGKVNIMMMEFHNMDSRFYIDYQGYIVRTGITREFIYPAADPDSVRSNVYSIGHGASFGLVFNQHGRFRGEFRYKAFWLNMKSFSLWQSEGQYYNNAERLKDGQTYIQPVRGKIFRNAIHVPEVVLSYKPNKDEDRRLYCRVALYNNFNKRYNFFQLQFGATANLREMFGKKQN
jgi:hypothetical protein